MAFIDYVMTSTFFIMIGMFIALLYIVWSKHGPNAREITEKIYENPTTNSCFQYKIEPVNPQLESIVKKNLANIFNNK